MTGFLLPPSDIFVAAPSSVGSLPELTVLVPVFDEPAVTLDRLLERLDPDAYPGALRITLVVSSTRQDDLLTARSVALAHRRARVEILTVRSITPKARGLNEALSAIDSPLVALFDADTRIDGATLAALGGALVSRGLDMIEAFDLTRGTQLRCRAANAQAIAFQRSMNGLQTRLGRRFMGTSSIIARRSLFARLGPLPEDGVEEGYRWSMNNPSEPVRHGLVPLLVDGDVPDRVGLMLNQRTRWITGQLRGSIDVLTGRVEGHRALAASGLASLVLQAIWVPLLPLMVVSRWARWIGAAVTAIELLRLGTPASRGLARVLGVRASPLAGLVLEYAEGFMVWRSLTRLVLRRADRWDRVRPAVSSARRRSQGEPPAG